MFQNYIIPKQKRKAAGQVKKHGFLKQLVFRSLNKPRSHHSRTMNYLLKKQVLIFYTGVTFVNVGKEL